VSLARQHKQQVYCLSSFFAIDTTKHFNFNTMMIIYAINAKRTLGIGVIKWITTVASFTSLHLDV